MHLVPRENLPESNNQGMVYIFDKGNLKAVHVQHFSQNGAAYSIYLISNKLNSFAIKKCFK